MALTLSQIGITQTQTINAWHVTQSIDAFTGVTAYKLTVSGSLTLTGSLHVSGSISASLGANTIGFHGTASFATSASYATTASYANTATSTSQVSGFYTPSGSAVGIAGLLNMFAGAGKTSTGPPFTSVVTVTPLDLTGKTLNQTLFLGIAPSQSSATVSATLSSPSSITFVSNVASTDFTFIGTYI